MLIDSDINKIQNYLTPDISKLQAKGVKSVKSRVVNLKEINSELTCDKMRDFLKTAAQEVYGLKVKMMEEPKAQETQRIAELYGSEEYIYKTPIPYTAVFKKRLSLGNFEFRILVKEGKVIDLQVFTDALDHKISEKLKASLMGVTYNIWDFEKALSKNFERDFVKEIINMIKTSAE
mgnify:FL=1